jgi:tetratricopeptide (TPR) repeat protein
MNGTTRTACYGVTAIATGLFGFLYFKQGALLSHAQGSKPLQVTYLTLAIISLAALGIFCFIDSKRYFSSRVEEWMVEGSSPTEPVPELEQAQKVRASGDPLEAIRLLREYLQTNPYALHVMSRIAEIYRYDLHNDLAAALEYEEMLKHRLPDDQWAWAALHLAKLYGRLNELEKSVTLLERLDADYTHTIAGRRAQKALAQMRNPGSGSGGDHDDSEPEGAVG